MKRTKLLVLALGLALVALFAAPAASAQDGPAVTLDPSSVDAPGEVTVTVTASGFTVPSVFVLPCQIPESGDLADITQDLCDVGNLTPGTPEDGGFSIEVTYDVPAEGLAVVVADAAQAESAAAAITVGGGDGGGDDAAADDGAADDGAADDGAADDAAADDAAAGGDEMTEGTDAELAETGVESSLLAILGAAVLGAGVMVIGFSRRFTRV